MIVLTSIKRVSPAIIIAASFILLVQAASEHARAAEKPNFIVVFCDDLGYGDLGCFGHPTINTPNLDQLAVDGQRWTNFYVGAAVCTPSRAAILTGRLPVRNGMMSGGMRVLFPDSKGGLQPSEITIAEALKPAGYASAAIGKWHLGHLPEYLPTAQGFETYWGIPYSNDMDPQPGFVSYTLESRKNPNFICPIEKFDVPIIHDTKVIERPANQHTLTQRYTDKALEFIRDKKDKPFFVYLAHSLPHIPLYAGKKHLGKSRRGLYGDVIEEIDAGVGQILSTLKELKIDKKTLVIFTSDNGPWLTFNTHGGSAGLLRHGKGSTYEGGMREPTIFWWPGKVKPGTQMELGATMDLLPTFCTLAGTEIPKDRTLDGYDLSPLLLGKTDKSPRDRMFYWRQEKLYAMRVGPWKAHFITAGSFGLEEERKVHETPLLYNLDNDPSEKYNVAEQHPELIEKLKAIAEKHQQSIEPVENQLDKR